MYKKSCMYIKVIFKNALCLTRTHSEYGQELSSKTIMYPYSVVHYIPSTSSWIMYYT